MPKSTRTYAAALKQIEELKREADTLRRKELQEVIARIKEAIAMYGLSAADLFGSAAGAKKRTLASSKSNGAAAPKKPKRAATKVKYSDANGNTWGGRGPRPHWLRDALASGKQLQDFAA
jgi:DNA-binding protein H-NS